MVQEMAQNLSFTILVKWSEDSGAMRLHLLLSSAYFDRDTFSCMYLQDIKVPKRGSDDELNVRIPTKRMRLWKTGWMIGGL